MYQLFSVKQIEIVNAILHVNAETMNCFFIHVSEGALTGKIFIYKTLYYILTGKRCNVKCIASTSIAFILLPNGRTSHKTFGGLKLPLAHSRVSNQAFRKPAN